MGLANAVHDPAQSFPTAAQEAELALEARLQRLNHLLERTHSVLADLRADQEHMSGELAQLQDRLRRMEGWQRMFTESFSSPSGDEVQQHPAAKR